MTEFASDGSFPKNRKIKDALIQHKALSKAGLSERLFGLLFSGLVYPQIWEDPDVDMQAMEIRPHHRIVTIGSGGCNMLAYLSQHPASIDVVDLNPHHVALNRLKLAAFRLLPGHGDLVRFFGTPDLKTNSQAFDRFIAPDLDDATSAYWNGLDMLGRRRVTVFNRNIYRTGLLGRFIGAAHLLGRVHGVKFDKLTAARTLREQRQFFDSEIAPVFERRLVRWLLGRKSSLFGLGIPPQPYDELASLAGDGSIAAVLRYRLEKLICHFPMSENYFAWQAFARRYAEAGQGPLPTYLKPENYQAIRANAERVTVHHLNFTELLATKQAGAMDRYVLLDAQDWMNDAQLNELWAEISRTAASGARVIFRTAAEKSIIEGRLSPAIRDQWDYLEKRSQDLNACDRSAIYGGFHIYGKRA
jgi:S-adenosylmethionine-diacylglycerol 3-amino-3-carboxypropyl transferase